MGKNNSAREGVAEIADPKTFDETLDSLTPKEQGFVLEYIKDFNGTRAAIAAHYSKTNARFQASRLLTKANISSALKCFHHERRLSARKTVDDIEKSLESIGFTDLTDVISFTRDGLTFAKDSEELSEDAKAALKRVEVTENMTGISVKVEMQDKVGALKLLGQQKGMFTKNLNLNVAVETYEQKRKRDSGWTI